MMIAVVARSQCPVCGYWLRSVACPTVRVNRRSLRQLPGPFLRTGEGQCPECNWSGYARDYRGLVPPQPGAMGSYLASPWRLTPKSEREVAEYRQRRWPG